MTWTTVLIERRGRGNDRNRVDILTYDAIWDAGGPDEFRFVGRRLTLPSNADARAEKLLRERDNLNELRDAALAARPTDAVIDLEAALNSTDPAPPDEPGPPPPPDPPPATP